MVATGLSNHPNDQREAEPTLDALDPPLGRPKAAAMDTGYFSEANIEACKQRSIEPYIAATGGEVHPKDLQTLFDGLPEAPGEEASPKEKMAYTLRTEIGQAIYRSRKCTAVCATSCT